MADKTSQRSSPTKRKSSSEVRAQADVLFASIGDGIIATDEFGKVTRVNEPGLEILGYTEAQILDKWFPQMVVAVDETNQPVNLIDRPITRAFLTGRTISERSLYRRRDGTIVPVFLTVSPILQHNRPIGAIEIFRDISEEYEIDRMKSEFISLASHQLRTPLSAIKTYAHMLVEGYMGELTGPQRRSLHTIIGATNRMNELISTLLNVTRIESGTITVIAKPLNLRKLIEEIMKELGYTARTKNVEVELNVHTRNPVVRTDALIAKEILSNLLTNAIKYTMPDGKVTVTIRSRGTNLLIAVTDTGFGIPEQAQEQIFTKFFRAQNAIRQETNGTGLGLYLVKGLTERLGGKVWFISKENEGSTFYLSLPKSAKSLIGSAKSSTTTQNRSASQ